MNILYDGSIVATSGFHIAKAIWAGGIPSEITEYNTIVCPYNEAFHCNAYERTTSRTLIPWNRYSATQDVAAGGENGDGSIEELNSPESAFDDSNKDLEKIRQMLDSVAFDNDLKRIFNAQCLVSCVTVLESYIQNVLTSLVLGVEKYYKKYSERLKVPLGVYKECTAREK